MLKCCCTVQGEMIQAKFGLAAVAERQLETYSTAVMLATESPPMPPRSDFALFLVCCSEVRTGRRVRLSSVLKHLLESLSVFRCYEAPWSLFGSTALD